MRRIVVLLVVFLLYPTLVLSKNVLVLGDIEGENLQEELKLASEYIDALPEFSLIAADKAQEQAQFDPKELFYVQDAVPIAKKAGADILIWIDRWSEYYNALIAYRVNLDSGKMTKAIGRLLIRDRYIHPSFVTGIVTALLYGKKKVPLEETVKKPEIDPINQIHLLLRQHLIMEEADSVGVIVQIKPSGKPGLVMPIDPVPSKIGKFAVRAARTLNFVPAKTKTEKTTSYALLNLSLPGIFQEQYFLDPRDQMWAYIVLREGTDKASEEPSDEDNYRKAVKARILGNASQIQFGCLAEGRKENSKLQGALVVEFEVDENGIPSSSNLTVSNISDPSVRDCVLKEISKWRFASPPEDIKNNRFKTAIYASCGKGRLKKGIPHGKWTIHNATGNKLMEGKLKKGHLNGMWRFWNRNGKLSYEENYKMDIADGNYKHWYKNGELADEGQYDNGKKVGLWKTWHTNGKIAMEEPYVNGETQGNVIQYNTAGHKIAEVHYLAGKRNGILRLWYDNGQMKEESKYKNDKLVRIIGAWNPKGEDTIKSETKPGIDEVDMEIYADNGQLTAKGRIIGDEKIGEWNYWFENGQLKQQETRVNGEADGTVKEWAKNGQLIVNQEYKNGIPVGPYMNWSENGTLVQKGQYGSKGEFIGTWKVWREDGVPYFEESYQSGRLNGQCKYWHENGKQSAIQNYLDGEMHGHQQFWHENGQLSMEGNSRYDFRDGTWEEYFENGQLIGRMEYRKGKLHGDSVFYWENGNKRSEGKFVNGSKNGVWKYWKEDGSFDVTQVLKDGKWVSEDPPADAGSDVNSE